MSRIGHISASRDTRPICRRQSPRGEPTDSADPKTDEYERAVADLVIRQAATHEVTDLAIERS